MFCKRCGRALKEGAKFCPKCGEIVPVEKLLEQIQRKKRKLHRRIAAVVTAVVVTLGACSGVFVFREEIWGIFHSDNSTNDSTDAAYWEVEESLDELLQGDTYQNLEDNGEKAELIQDTLKDLEESNKIKKNSISYDETQQVVWYENLDGLSSGIMIGGFTEGFSGKANVDNYVTWKSEGVVSQTHDEINFSSGDFPYTKEQIESLNLSALYMFGLCDDTDVNNSYYKYYQDYQINQTNWNKNGLKTNLDSYCTVEDFMTELSGYSIIFVELHGAHNDKSQPILCTRERVTEKNKQTYLHENGDGDNLSTIREDDSSSCWCLNPSFIEKYYGDGKLSDTIVWLGSCYGYETADLVEAFEKSGAKSIVGFDNSVRSWYNYLMQTAFVYDLMYGDTASNALDFAKSIYFYNDKDWDRAYFPSSDGNSTASGAVAKLNDAGKDAKLIELTETEPTTEPEPTTPALVQAVLDNEADWKAAIKEYDANVFYAPGVLEPEKTGLLGDDVFWFQDFDMDGQVEFVVKSKISDAKNQDMYQQDLNIYYWDETNQKLARYAGKDENEDCTLYIILNNQEEMYENKFQLYKDKTTEEFLYLQDGFGEDQIWDRLLLLHLDKDKTWNQNIFQIWIDDYYDGAGGCNIGDSVECISYSDGIDWYNNYKSNLTAYSYTTQKIEMSDWESMSDKEKQQALEDSYNAWSYSEGSTEDFPLTDVVEEIESNLPAAATAELTQEQLNSVKEALHVPSDMEVTIEQSTPEYSDSYAKWLITVSVYDSDGTYIAGAKVDSETAQLNEDIQMYTGAPEKCGDNATWSLDESTGTLTISGTGDIYDYGDYAYDGQPAPWCGDQPYATNVKTVIIEEGITGIGEYTFFGSGVTSVSLPSTLTKIGMLAFHNCTDLHEITIPKSVVAIEDRAFGIYGEESTMDDFTVYGYTGSAAQQYVEEVNAMPYVENPIKFVALD